MIDYFIKTFRLSLYFKCIHVYIYYIIRKLAIVSETLVNTGFADI
nr:MAG TPA: hypothetical protein [Caudoviricetes sp.]